MSRRGWALFLAMAVIWGLPYLLIRIAVRQLEPGVLVLMRTAPVALLLTPLVWRQRQFPALLKNVKWIAAFGVAEFGIPWFLMSTAEEHITSSLTSLLICCVPLFSVLAQRLRRSDEHIAPRRYVGLAIGAVGVAFLVGFDLGGGTVTWIGMMLLVCVGYTIGPVILATKLKDVNGTTLVMGATGIVSLAWLPWAVIHWPHTVSSETWECIGVLSLVCTAGAFLTFFELVKEIGATRATVVTYFNTAIAVMLGIVGLHEPLTAGIIVGFPLVIVGCVIATRVPRESLTAAQSY